MTILTQRMREELVRRGLQVLPGKVQINGRGLDIHVPHQQLNGSKISAGFEQVRRVAMPQRVARTSS